jgi:hypothetical protein
VGDTMVKIDDIPMIIYKTMTILPMLFITKY